MMLNLPPRDHIHYRLHHSPEVKENSSLRYQDEMVACSQSRRPRRKLDRSAEAIDSINRRFRHQYCLGVAALMALMGYLAALKLKEAGPEVTIGLMLQKHLYFDEAGLTSFVFW